MKTFLSVSFIAFMFNNMNCFCADTLTDPLLDYYNNVMQCAQGVDAYLFLGKFTKGTRNSVFITDSTADFGNQFSRYTWTVYYPVGSHRYRMALCPTGFQVALEGPDYLGYVDELKKICLLEVTSHNTIIAYYLTGGTIFSQFLGKNGFAYAEDFPQYFKNPQEVKVKKYSAKELKKLFRP